MNRSTTSLESLLSLKGKTALITGAAQGIGRAIAERYAEAGANLQLLDVSEELLAKAATELSKKFDVTISTHTVDLGDETALLEFWDNLTPLPDVLINNAGVFWPKKLTAIDTASYDKIMNINTRAVVTNCRELVARRGGRPATIVNIASIEAVKGMTFDMMLYGASKAAMLAVSRAIVKDYGKEGWKCNTILPGGVSTPGGAAMAKTALKHLDFSIVATSLKFALRMPTKGIGKPDDIARAALWLGTPMSDYMNGAEVVVDGGFLAV
ncbi:MAG: SDR family oxidoreductase [Candidatus Saccharimonas sp.]